MALTIAQIETVLMRRRGPAMVAADLFDSVEDMNASASPRQGLSDPIARGLRLLGFQPADPVTPADSDLTGLAFTDYDALFDVAELRLLETLIGNFPDVDYTEGGSAGRKLQQFRADLQAERDWKRKQVAADYPSLKLGEIK